jgi:hypothetical protein
LLREVRWGLDERIEIYLFLETFLSPGKYPLATEAILIIPFIRGAQIYAEALCFLDWTGKRSGKLTARRFIGSDNPKGKGISQSEGGWR